MYSVGDILWIVRNDRPGVMPYSVVEEVTKKTISGIETAFFVESAGESDRKIKLDNLNGEIYTSVEDAKSALMQKAEQAIDKMLNKGLSLLDSVENYPEEPETQSPAEDITKNIVQEETVVLPDGSKAKVNIIGDLP